MKLVDQCEQFLRKKIDGAVTRSTDEWLEIRGGDLEKELGWTRRMPTVSAAMYKVRLECDSVRYQPPKGRGNNLRIAYNLAHRRSGTTSVIAEGRSRYRNVTRAAVLAAIDECNRLGREEFLDEYGFGAARSYFLVHEGVEYDSKAILGAAYGYEFPEEGALGKGDFSGGDATVRAHLEVLGFEVRVEPGSRPSQRQQPFDELIRDAADDLAGSGEFDAFDTEDARERIARQVAARAGQPKFRAALLKAYEGRCVLSECAVAEVLEAAHIAPYRGEKSNDVRNGLLLRSDLHTLLDRGLISIEKNGDGYRATVAPSLLDGPYGEFDKRLVRRPVSAMFAPDAGAVAMRAKLLADE